MCSSIFSDKLAFSEMLLHTNMTRTPVEVVPQFVNAKLVQITPISLWFMVDISVLFLWFLLTNVHITGGHLALLCCFHPKLHSDHTFFTGQSISSLVGGLEHEFYDFPFSWECHPPNWRNQFFREVGQPPTRSFTYLPIVGEHPLINLKNIKVSSENPQI